MSDVEARSSVQFALKNGYTMIDTASIYHNEVGVGEGIKASGVPREKFWITSKVYPAILTELTAGVEYLFTIGAPREGSQ